MNKAEIRELLEKAVNLCIKEHRDRCIIETPEFIVCEKECLDEYFHRVIDWKLENIIGRETPIISIATKNCKKDKIDSIVIVYGRETCKLDCLINHIKFFIERFEKLEEKEVGVY